MHMTPTLQWFLQNYVNSCDNEEAHALLYGRILNYFSECIFIWLLSSVIISISFARKKLYDHLWNGTKWVLVSYRMSDRPLCLFWWSDSIVFIFPWLWAVFQLWKLRKRRVREMILVRRGKICPIEDTVDPHSLPGRSTSCPPQLWAGLACISTVTLANVPVAHICFCSLNSLFELVCDTFLISFIHQLNKNYKAHSYCKIILQSGVCL